MTTMNEVKLTALQQSLFNGDSELLPATKPDTGYQIPDGASVTFEEVMEKKCVVLSDRALLVCQRWGLTGIFSCNHRSILAESHQAAVDALVKLACLPCGLSGGILILNSDEMPRHGCLSGDDLKVIYTANSQRFIQFYSFSFTHEQALAIAEVEVPICLSLNGCFSRKSAWFLLNQIIHKRTTKCSRLVLERSLNHVLGLFTNVLQAEKSIIMEDLQVNLRDESDELVGLALLQCPHSIGHLELDCLYMRPTNAKFWPGVARSIAEGTCPPRLQLLVEYGVPEAELVVQALSSPRCRVEKINVLASAPVEWYQMALAKNRSLREIQFYLPEDPKFLDKELMDIVAAHPKLETVRFEFLTERRFDFSTDMISASLTRKRRLRLIFPKIANKNRMVEDWEALFHPEMSLNRFHCGVADDMVDVKHPDRPFQLAFLECIRNRGNHVNRIAILLHHHTTILIEMLCRESS